MWWYSTNSFSCLKFITGRNFPFFLGTRKILEMNLSVEYSVFEIAPLANNSSTCLSSNSLFCASTGTSLGNLYWKGNCLNSIWYPLTSWRIQLSEVCFFHSEKNICLTLLNSGTSDLETSSSFSWEQVCSLDFFGGTTDVSYRHDHHPLFLIRGIWSLSDHPCSHLCRIWNLGSYERQWRS